MIIQLLCLTLFSIAFRQFAEPFAVFRSWADTFPNPECTGSFCPRVCHRYDAVCWTKEMNCTTCSCSKDEHTRTFVANEKRGKCVTADEIVYATVPRQKVTISSTSTSSDNATLYQCLYAEDELLQLDCLNDRGYYWIYTKKKRLISLRLLLCLDAENSSEVVVSPCATRRKYQEWSCKGSFLYQERNGMNMSLQSSGLSSTSFFLHTWKPNSLAIQSHENISCGPQIDYQGCYRFNDKRALMNLAFYPRDCQEDCFTTIKVMAPMFEENTKCSILWQKSTFMKDDKPWQSVNGHENDFMILNGENDSRTISLQIPYKSYNKWSGSIIRLEVQCASETSQEQHCVLIKFHSVYFADEDRQPHEEKNRQSKSNPYKTSTIILAILITAILAGILIYMTKKRNFCPKRAQRNHSNPRIPFCEDEEASI